MTKDELLGIFRTCHNNCKLVYVSMIILSHEDMPKFFDEFHKKLDIPKPYIDMDLLPLLYDRNVLKIAISQLYDTVHIAALRDLFEQIKNYCSETGQEAILQKQPWYQFWRISRNCFSHDFKFQFLDYDKKKLPFSWGGFTIEESLEGTKLTHGQFPREKLLDFLQKINIFIEKELA